MSKKQDVKVVEPKRDVFAIAEFARFVGIDPKCARRRLRKSPVDLSGKIVEGKYKWNFNHADAELVYNLIKG